MKSKPTLVVLAAGMGSRYGGLKQIDPVGPSGEILMEYSLYDALRAGFGRAVFVIRRDIEDAFRSAIEPRFAGRIPFAYVYQDLADVPAPFEAPAGRPKPWGTGHAVYAARREVREPFGVINADDFVGRESLALLADRLNTMDPTSSDFCLVAFQLRNTLSEHGPVSRGVCRVTRDGWLEGVTERKKIEQDGPNAKAIGPGGEVISVPGDTPVSVNLAGFTPRLFEHLEREFKAFLASPDRAPDAELQLPTVVDSLIRQDCAKVYVLRSSERWLGVTYPQDKASVKAGLVDLIGKGVYSKRLWEMDPRGGGAQH